MTERSKAMATILPRGARVLRSTPPTVTLSGISTRAGVGGRRGRKKRRAEERKAQTLSPAPQSNAFRLYRAWGEEELAR